MRVVSRLSAIHRATALRSLRNFTSTVPHSYGRSATYRRPAGLLQSDSSSLSPNLFSLLAFPKRGNFLVQETALHPTHRNFTSSALRLQEQRQREEGAADGSRATGSAEQAGSRESNRKAEDQAGEDSKSSEEQAGDGRERRKQEKKEDAPPPPPHGNKSPWQVFTETLQSEFKASKEWNESTKAIASSAHQFTENESVKRARAAYSAASGAATSTTTSALKSTGKVIGQSAAWTWDTPVVKGVRTGVNLTGKGIEKATRPVRETQVYKTAVGGVKDVIDDGSSSRYGGWLEKEERRKQKELRELKESARTGGKGRRVEKMEEDPT